MEFLDTLLPSARWPRGPLREWGASVQSGFDVVATLAPTPLQPGFGLPLGRVLGGTGDLCASSTGCASPGQEEGIPESYVFPRQGRCPQDLGAVVRGGMRA